MSAYAMRCSLCRGWIGGSALKTDGATTRFASSAGAVSQIRSRLDSKREQITTGAQSRPKSFTERPRARPGIRFSRSKLGDDTATSSRKTFNPSTRINASPSRSQPSKPVDGATTDTTRSEPEQWKVQKWALKKKFGEEGWQPRKKISPDDMSSLRDLHKTDPKQFNSEKLAQMFELSPEAIRRILKSKWQPTEKEEVERLERWEKRGEIVWATLAKKGKIPPKKWRAKGIGLTNWEKKAAEHERLKLLGFDVPELEPRPEYDPTTSRKRRGPKDLPWDMESLKILKESNESYGPSPLEDPPLERKA